MQHFRVGHVHFILFMSILFASGTQRELGFQWNMGLKVLLIEQDTVALSSVYLFTCTPTLAYFAVRSEEE